MLDLISSIRARLLHYITKANIQRSVVGVQPFCGNKNHPDNPKVRLCPLQKDVPQSYARMRVRVQDFAAQIINASINNGAVNMKKRQQCRNLCAFIASSTVEWNLGFGSLSRLTSPGCSDPFVGRRGAWKRRRFPVSQSHRTGLQSFVVVFGISFTSS